MAFHPRCNTLHIKHLFPTDGPARAMWLLYHYPLCAFSRKTRIILAEYRIDFASETEQPWDRREDFIALSPGAMVPVLTREDDERVLSDSTAIFEYLHEENETDVDLLGPTALARAEARRLAGWFDVKFQQDVTRHVFDEMITKRFFEKAPANAKAMRAMRHNLDMHLRYIEYLFNRRRWLAGETFSIGDISAAAQISIADYLGLINWTRHESARDWYVRVKSRPSMRPILADVIPQIRPAAQYAKLDF